MTLTKLPANLPKLLRDRGLTVVEVDGWEDRGRPASKGTFRPVGVLWHHTGSVDKAGDPADDLAYARWLANVGRADLPAPLCHLSISAEGVVYVIAAGRANHAGEARASGSVAEGDGNSLYVGVECMNSGSQGWPAAQYAAMVTTGAVLMDVLGTSAEAQRAHRETSKTGKWDPGMVNMPDFREDIDEQHRAWAGKPSQRTYPRAEQLLVECDDLLRRLYQARTKGGAELKAIVAPDEDRIAQAVGNMRQRLRGLVADS